MLCYYFCFREILDILIQLGINISKYQIDLEIIKIKILIWRHPWLLVVTQCVFYSNNTGPRVAFLRHWETQTRLEQLLYFVRNAREGERLVRLFTAHPNKPWAERTFNYTRLPPHIQCIVSCESLVHRKSGFLQL